MRPHIQLEPEAALGLADSMRERRRRDVQRSGRIAQSTVAVDRTDCFEVQDVEQRGSRRMSVVHQNNDMSRVMFN